MLADPPPVRETLGVWDGFGRGHRKAAARGGRNGPYSGPDVQIGYKELCRSETGETKPHDSAVLLQP